MLIRQSSQEPHGVPIHVQFVAIHKRSKNEEADQLKCMILEKVFQKKLVEKALNDSRKVSVHDSKVPTRDSTFAKLQKNSCPKAFCEKPFLKIFAKTTGKHLCRSLFLMNLWAYNLQLYQKRDSITGVFL